MAEIATEHRLRIAGYVEVDLKLHLTYENTETVLGDGTETMVTLELNTELRDEEMVTKQEQRSEMMVTQ